LLIKTDLIKETKINEIQNSNIKFGSYKNNGKRKNKYKNKKKIIAKLNNLEEKISNESYMDKKLNIKPEEIPQDAIIKHKSENDSSSSDKKESYDFQCEENIEKFKKFEDQKELLYTNKLKENLIIVNNTEETEFQTPKIEVKPEENISDKSLDKKQSQSSATSSKNEKNLNDSTCELRINKIKESLEDGKSNFARNRERQDSILTEIQENLNENYSSITKFFNRESVNNNANGTEDNNSESNKNEFENNYGPNDSKSLFMQKNNLKKLLDKAIAFKLLANEFFKKNKFNDAIREYTNVNNFHLNNAL